MKEFLKRIMIGPITIMIIYADWCSHCHDALPRFKEAAKHQGRTGQAIAMNETMMNHASAALQKSVNQNSKGVTASAFPTVLIVDKNANVITEVNMPRTTEDTVKLMNQSGIAAVETGVGNASMKVSPLTSPIGEPEPIGEASVASMKVSPLTSPIGEPEPFGEPEPIGEANINRLGPESITPLVNESPIRSPLRNETPQEIMRNVVKNLKSPVMNIQPGVGLSPVGMADRKEGFPYNMRNPYIDEGQLRGSPGKMPPMVVPKSHTDIIESPLPPNLKVRGGSLYQAMSQTAYQLAPPAILFATAAKVMKYYTRKHKQRKHTQRKQRRR
jgi:thiol-disulfide isomerase/thioredoxin